MSGSSLDGADIAYCEFRRKKNTWTYKVPYTITYDYSPEWRKKLKNAFNASANELAGLDVQYGMFLGKILSVFMKESKIKPDFIASHGHTVFHNPEQHYTMQIGNGGQIAARTKTAVINDFRSSDIARGGQGAPLVPIGDKLLFGEYDFCLNLGGIANISFDDYTNQRKAFDIVPCNMALNMLAGEINQPYDENGDLAREGQIDINLLEELNALDFYWMTGSKSLGREWFEKNILPVLTKSQASTRNKLATFTEHIALQIGKVTSKFPGSSILITGGGACNSYLIERISEAVSPEVFLPEKKLIDYKEAIIFGFLGVLRYRSEVNTLRSVTGATSDSSGGVIWLP